MPIFHYLCRKCGKKFDLFQRITDDPLKSCSYCGGRADILEESLRPSPPKAPPMRVVKKSKPLKKKRAAKKVVMRSKKRTVKKAVKKTKKN